MNKYILESLLITLIISFIPVVASTQKFPKCQTCHKYMDTKKVLHPALKSGCVSCHTQPHDQGAPFPKFLFAKGVDLCWGCHDKTPFSRQVTHPPVAGGGCMLCHDVHSSDTEKILLFPVPDLCFNCHDKTQFENTSTHPPVAAGTCTACHDPHSSDAHKLLSTPRPELCFNCHSVSNYFSETKKKHHSPVATGLCNNCHDPHASASERLLLAGTPEICFKCHFRGEFQGKYNHAPVAGGMCMSCHVPHQGDVRKLLIAKPPDLCFNCHETTEFKRKNPHPPVSAGMCAICHDLHASDNVAQLHLPINEGCLLCHPKIGKAPHATGTFTSAGHPLKDRDEPKSKYGKLSCASCHDPHSSDSVKLFRYKAHHSYELCPHCHAR